MVSAKEYLSTSYDPDLEYVGGELVGRNVRETDHVRLQALIAAYLINREQQWRIVVYTDARTQVLATHFRLPDICVLRGNETEDQIIRTPPFLCVEILRKRLGYVHTAVRTTRAEGGILSSYRCRPSSTVWPKWNRRRKIC